MEDTDTTLETSGLLSKKSSDLTVGETITANVVMTAALAAIVTTAVCAPKIVTSVKTWHQNRKLEKNVEKNTDITE